MVPFDADTVSQVALSQLSTTYRFVKILSRSRAQPFAPTPALSG